MGEDSTAAREVEDVWGGANAVLYALEAGCQAPYPGFRRSDFGRGHQFLAADSALYGRRQWAVVLLRLDHGVLFPGTRMEIANYGPCEHQPLVLDSDDDHNRGIRKRDRNEKWEDKKCPVLTLDDARYHSVDSQEVPNGYATMPVTVHDNGYEFPAVMVACTRRRVRSAWLRRRKLRPRRGGGSMRVVM